MKIEHVGNGRNSESLRKATEFIHSIANSLRLTDEFTVGYEKSATGSQLIVKTMVAEKVEPSQAPAPTPAPSQASLAEVELKTDEKVELPAETTPPAKSSKKSN